MKIDYIFPRRISSSNISDRAKLFTEWKMALKFTALINIKFSKLLKNKCFFNWLLKTPKPSITIFVFYKNLAVSFNALNKTKWCILIPQECLTGWSKKGETNATKQSWEIDILYSLVRKTKFDLILHAGPIPKNYC